MLKKLLLVILLSCISTIGFAQIKLMSSTPRDNAAGVALSTTLTFTFDKPINGEINFEEDVLAFPIDKMEYKGSSLDAEGTTLSIELDLQPDTDYVFGFLNLYSPDGSENLENAFTINFTTAEAQGPHAVSGRVIPFGMEVPMPTKSISEPLSYQAQLNAAKYVETFNKSAKAKASFQKSFDKYVAKHPELGKSIWNSPNPVEGINAEYDFNRTIVLLVDRFFFDFGDDDDDDEWEEEAQVQDEHGDDEDEGPEFELFKATVTDDEGIYVMSGVRPGNYFLVAVQINRTGTEPQAVGFMMDEEGNPVMIEVNDSLFDQHLTLFSFVPRSAKQAHAFAEQAALAIYPDARLLAMFSEEYLWIGGDDEFLVKALSPRVQNHNQSAEPTGKSQMWAFVFHSPEEQVGVFVASTPFGGIAMFEMDETQGPEDIEDFNMSDVRTLDLSGYIDSDEIVLTAMDEDLGDFIALHKDRYNYMDVYYEAGHLWWMVPQTPKADAPNLWMIDAATWYYDVVRDNWVEHSLSLLYNANTGDKVRVQATSLDEPNATPESMELMQNYPNPFNPNTVIPFKLNTTGLVRLEVYNLLGQKVATLQNGVMNAGTHQISFSAAHLTSGMYFYRLEANGLSMVKKMMLVK